MSIERKKILKSYLILCEGKDAEGFLINYLESEALAKDQRFSNDIQILDFGGNENLSNYLMNLMNMDKFDRVTSLAVIRDAENDYDKACREVIGSLRKCGFTFPSKCAEWVDDKSGMLRIGFILFPLNNTAGTLEDLCLRTLSENNSKSVLHSIDSFLDIMESSCGRNYRRRHKNKVHTYLSSSEKYVTMPLGMASRAGAFNWNSAELEPLKIFLEKGFDISK